MFGVFLLYQPDFVSFSLHMYVLPNLIYRISPNNFLGIISLVLPRENYLRGGISREGNNLMDSGGFVLQQLVYDVDTRDFRTLPGIIELI